MLCLSLAAQMISNTVKFLLVETKDVYMEEMKMYCMQQKIPR